MNLSGLPEQLAREGHRRLLVLSGDDTWTQQQALLLKESYPGDWLWVGDNAPQLPSCSPQALNQLLGREFLHAIFDARQGFDVSAFAAVGGTLRAGSLLVLLTPALALWPEKSDQDSLRWSDRPEPIPTPRFIEHFCRHISRDPQVLLWQQGAPCPPLPTHSAPDWHPASGT